MIKYRCSKCGHIYYQLKKITPSKTKLKGTEMEVVCAAPGKWRRVK
jgi:hypothetical protein